MLSYKHERINNDPHKKNNNQCVETELSRFDIKILEKKKIRKRIKTRKEKKENNGRNDEIKTA